MSSYTVGLDLGQGLDYSALTVVERVIALPPYVSTAAFWRSPQIVGPGTREEFHVRALRRWELGTPYPVVVADVVAMMRTDVLDRDGVLFVDATGVGRAVTDLFWDEYREASFGCFRPQAVTITGGRERHERNVPKTDLIAAIQVPLQQGRLKIATGLALGSVLEQELTGFRQTITQTGRESYDIQRRAGQGHGDLVMSLALALFQPNTLRRPDVVEHTGAFERKDTP